MDDFGVNQARGLLLPVIREGSRKSFDPQYRENTKPRSGTRAGEGVRE